MIAAPPGQRLQDRLSASQLSVMRQLPWQADTLRVNNPTDQIIYIRYGGQDVPSPTNYDDLVPAFADRSIPVHVALFALALAGTPSSPTARAVVTYSRFDPPQLSAGYQQLGLAAAAALEGSGVTGTLGPFDLSSWGGLIVSGAPAVNNWDQQGWCAYEVSADAATWTRIARLPLWPGMTLVAQLPRLARYGRVTWQAYGAPWAVAPSFSLRARPTLTEILQIAPVLSGQPQEWTWGPLVAPGATVGFVAPGDLVASIDWTVSNASNAGTGSVDTGGTYGTVTPTTDLIVSQIPLAAVKCIHGSLTNLLPQASLFIRVLAGTINGVFSFVPRLLAGQPDVMGQPFDPVTAGTLPGLLRLLDQDLSILGTSLSVPGSATILGTLFGRIVTPTILAGGPTTAATWTSTGATLPAGSFLVGGEMGIDTVAGTTEGIRLAFGTGAAVNVATAFHAIDAQVGHPGVVPLPVGFRVQVPAAGNNTVWIITSTARVFTGCLYTSTT